MSEYSELQRILMSASWSLLRQYHLPDNYRMTQNALDKFSSAMNELDPLKRHRMMKYLERDFAMYAPYWFYRAKSANESGNYDEAGKCFERFGEVWRPVLRKDPYRAEAMKYKIEALMRSGVSQNNAGEILKCLEEMRANTELDEWASNIFAGLVYSALGRKDEAEECVMCNIDFGFEIEISGKILEQIETEELPPRIEPLPEKIEPAPVIVAEPPKSEPQPKVQETPPAPKPKRPPMSDDDFIELCKFGDAVKVEEAINNGANVNAVNNFSGTALMWAENAEIAEILIKYGADVNARNNDGRTALMSAAKNGNAEVAEVLIKHGADIDAKDNDGKTALMSAAKNGNAEVAEVLIKHGADVNAKDNEGWTALMVAALNGNTDVAELLLKHGADVNARDKNGRTALMMAQNKNHGEVADLLRKYGAKE